MIEITISLYRRDLKFFFTLFSIALFVIAPLAFAGTLSCSITTAAACTGGTNAVILRMAASTNTHVELPSQSTASYGNNVVCCSGVTGLGNSCSGTFAVVGHLAAVTNSHYEENTFSNFSNNACISVPGGSVTIGYQTSNCSGFDTTLFSVPATSNTHIGGPSDYTNRVCGSANNPSITFTVSTNSFTSITAGNIVFATTTLDVNTTNATGWNVTLSGDNKATGTNNLQSGANSIPDQLQWINNAATTSPGNAVRIASFTDSNTAASTQNVLAFRVMTASGTADMRISSWWGSQDNYVDNVNTLWAGISSSSPSRKIVVSGAGSYQSSDHLGTVLYYLSVPVAQAQGSYSAPLTYSGTAN
ncbi:MAG: hypothetical protein JO026_00120 [Patescibacteria group bacterium]|nr:hypothetical protein [Patescibacteria group bacterium]